MKIAKLNIDGYIGSADMMSMFSGEEVFGLTKLKKFLDTLESDVTDIHVYINSGGGSVTEGWAIYDKLKNSGKSITTIGEGIVGSIATVIYMAGSVRKLHENSKFFIHNPYWQANDASPMESSDLKRLALDLEKEQTKILDFYALSTGKERSLIEPLMTEATDLTTKEAIELGFATDVINAAVNYHSYQLVAMLDIKKQPIKTDKMSKNVTSILGRFSKKMQAFMKGNFFNMDLAVKDSNGEEKLLYIETETEDLTEKSAYLVDGDGNQTVAPSGDYTDASGKVIVIVDGVVKEVKDAVAKADEPTVIVDEAFENLKAENEALKAELVASKKESENFKNSFSEMETEFKILMQTVIGAKTSFDVEGQQFVARKENTKTLGANENFLNELANQFKK